MQVSPMALVTISSVCVKPSFKPAMFLNCQPDAKFWAGERYYRRQHIDIDDFYPLDMSGYGGGVEDLNVGIGKLAVAFLNGARPDIVTQNGNLAKSNIDVRLYDLKGPAAVCGAVWFDFATSKGGTTSAGTVDSHIGWIRVRAAPSTAWSGTAAITRFRSSTEPERPATSVILETVDDPESDAVYQ